MNIYVTRLVPLLTLQQKPTDLPESPHDIPHPIPPSSEKTNPLDTTPKTGTGAVTEDPEAGGVIQPFHSFVLSLTMIIFSEIGDKTFLVAALMAMRHPRILVFSAAFSALIVMTVLSAVLGHAVPTLIPERFTHLAAAVLFLVFGVKLMREGLAMSPDEGVGEEMREVEQELEEKETLARQQKGGRRKSSISPYVLESGRARRSRSQSRLPAPARSPSSSPDRAHSSGGSSLSSALSGLNNLFSLLLSPAWVQTFVMTFLGEWGDRSQIATVAMAAGSDYWWVTGGAIFGHGLCTAGAVIGGRAIAGKVSMRVGKCRCSQSATFQLRRSSYPGRCHCFPRIRRHLSVRSHLPRLNVRPLIQTTAFYGAPQDTHTPKTATCPISVVISSFACNSSMYEALKWGFHGRKSGGGVLGWLGLHIHKRAWRLRWIRLRDSCVRIEAIGKRPGDDSAVKCRIRRMGEIHVLRNGRATKRLLRATPDDLNKLEPWSLGSGRDEEDDKAHIGQAIIDVLLD